MRASVDYFCSDSIRHDLKGKTVRGGLVTAAAQLTTALLSLITIPIMARLLQPADFGLVAMVTVFTGFAAMFVDAGLSMATIQRDEITHQQVSNMFWLAAALGLVIAAMVACLSPTIAWFYAEPRLVPITLALTASLVFGGLTVQQQALLRRMMQFRALAVIQVACYLAAYSVAILIAWRYRTYWALVAMPITLAFSRMLAMWWACGWRPSLPRREAGMREMIGFGANLTGFNFINYFARNADNMLIGWWWGASPLGFYERAYRLMMAPLNQINAPLAHIMVPALSRLADQPIKYRNAYIRAVGLLQVASCPLMAFVIVTAPWVVDVVFGPEWDQAATILRWLAIAGFLQPLSNSLGWLYVSQGRGRDMMRWGMLGCSLIVLAFAAGLPWGPVGVARAYALTICVLIVPLAYWFAGRRGPVTTIDLWRMSLTAVALAMPTFLIALISVSALAHLSSAAGLVISGIGSAVASAAIMLSSRAGRRSMFEGLRLLQHAITPSMPMSKSTSPSPPGE